MAVPAAEGGFFRGLALFSCSMTHFRLFSSCSATLLSKAAGVTSAPPWGTEPAGMLLSAAGRTSSPQPLWEKGTKLFWELNNNNRFCLLPEIARSTCLLTCYPEERTCAQSPCHPTLTLHVNPREVFTAMFLALVSSGWPRPGYIFCRGLSPARNKAPRSCSPTPPPQPQWDEEKIERKACGSR